MADDVIRDAVMKAFPLKAPTPKPKVEEHYQYYEDNTPVEYDKDNVEIPEKLLTNKSGMDLLGEALQSRIEKEKEPEDSNLDEVRAKANETIDESLIRDLLGG